MEGELYAQPYWEDDDHGRNSAQLDTFKKK